MILMYIDNIKEEGMLAFALNWSLCQGHTKKRIKQLTDDFYIV